MSDINPLGASTYYGGLQNATSQAARELKKEKTSSTAQVAFSKLVQSNRQTEEQKTLEAQGLPPEIAGMSIEEAAIFLKDRVDTAGNKLSEAATSENIIEFKNTVKQFIKYVVDNNYVEYKKTRRGFAKPQQIFSKYNTKERPKDPRLIIETINQKLDNMVRETLTMQAGNLKILDHANEIRGLIVDLIQA
ncbi:MAG: YaaR family protein [Treponema sp.]|nr:YaaR family protein [Treponema sp.]